MMLSKKKHEIPSVTDGRFDTEKTQWQATYRFTVGLTNYHR